MENRNTNKLINEQSPYLLQHAYNPVKWYPWGEEAFEKAKKEDKPIFLSIGYSTCHWCHVMERESFEDEYVAKLLNDNYISIKVDREERPDIDNIYMTVCQLLTGHGGWPLTIFMGYDKKPFYAGTYFPKESRYGVNGLCDMLLYFSEMWKNSREKLYKTKENINENLKGFFVKKESEETIDKSTVEDTYIYFKNTFDSVHGGFGNEPKFPTPHNLMFLLRYYKTTGKKEALNMVEKTLESMYKGGIFDHIGYGFSRYSTDNKWLVPHFEKMLYDNALLLMVYTECFQITKNELYRKVSDRIIKYVNRTLRSGEGAFYSAEDADSEGVEGKYYLWSKEEVEDILGSKIGEKFCNYYNIISQGIFSGKNIPNLINNNFYDNEIEKEVKKMYAIRNKRIKPFLDDKVLTSWNGLMIAALAYAGRVYNNNEYVKYAKEAYKYIIDNLIDNEERIYSSLREGVLGNKGFLEDYANVIWGCIELYQATFEKTYLVSALMFYKETNNLFWDDKNGGYFQYGEDAEELLVRPKDIFDNALPCGNSVMLNNIFRLYKLTGDYSIKKQGERQKKYFSGIVLKNTAASSFYICGAMFDMQIGSEIVISGQKEEESTKKFIEKINNSFLPFTIVLLVDDISENYKKINDETTIYVCEDNSCKPPINSIFDFDKYLN